MQPSGATAGNATATAAPPAWSIKPQFASWDVDHSRYQLVRRLGAGAIGFVAEAIDRRTGARVAIKRTELNDASETFEETQKRVFREIRILSQLNHPNIIKLLHVQKPASLLDFPALYAVYECLDSDLAKLIRDDSQCLTIPHVRWFLYQLLLSVKYLHSARILHRDIKPGNILITESCDLKLCDFNLARSIDEDGVLRTDALPDRSPFSSRPTMSLATDGVLRTDALPDRSPISPTPTMTKQVLTRSYRAPEILLYNDGVYSTPIDMWGVGCVFAEMLSMLDTGEPECRFDRRMLFPCYSTSQRYKEELQSILDVLGTPAEAHMTLVRTKEAAEYLRSLHPRRPEDFDKRYPTAGRDAIDLLRGLVSFFPEHRLTADTALAHPFLAPVRRPLDEVVHGGAPADFSGGADLHQLIVQVLRHYNPEISDDWEAKAAAQLASCGRYSGLS